MIKRALNQKTSPHLSYEEFLDLAKALGCVGVEPRNDLGRGLFDGISAREAGAMARERGLRLFLLQPDNRLLVVLMLGTQMVNAGGHSPCQLMTETMSLPGGAVVAAQWKRS